ncbi:MAG: hypothetical protein PHX20_00680 [Candidatus Omnitrophica bacterium]|nr:hypothetical protein [Candidatus Omnitrophota bacterium]MDD5436048.1 hypothetical protein [Candidatus Omnitrophota bacterium]
MSNRRAHTIAEVLVAAVIAVIFFTSAMGVFVMAKRFYASGMSGQELQRDVDRILNRIIRGLEEGGTRYGTRSGASFTSPIADITRLDFVGTDGNTRSIYLTAGGIVYESPTQAPNQQVIYTPPANSVLTLRFWEPAGYADHETVAIYIGLSKQVSGKVTSGSLTTYVNLRNIAK